jgi:uncharacterized coiled-coil DUF342 family protein
MEQVACVLQFLGIAESLYTADYAKLIRHKMDVEQLRARREQYNETLGEVARDVVSEPSLTVSLTVSGVRKAKQQIETDIDRLRSARIAILEKARDAAVPPQDRSRISRLTERRAELINTLETTRKKADETTTRISELKVYRENLSDEINRLDRAADAGSVLADLRITHCPACDQVVVNEADNSDHCFLCHQPLQSEPIIEHLGAVRLQFERDRLSGEMKETVQLSDVLERESASLAAEIKLREEEFAKIEDELVPARTNVGGLAQAEISEIDMSLGQAGERQRQIERVLNALDLGRTLTERIQVIEREIGPLQDRVDAQSDAIDYDAAASELEDGMNDYLNAINGIRPGSWKHNPVAITLSRSKLDIRVGSRRWQLALGGTDTLYFLMAYQFGLLTLSNKEGSHYPGLSVIDVPGELSGEAIEDQENFIIQPFIDLMTNADYEATQIIITGASFKGLDGVNRLTLRGVHVA